MATYLSPSQKRRRGRPRLPFAGPSRPYSEWPTVQLLAECRRRAIPVVRKGPRANASKRGLILALTRADANSERSPQIQCDDTRDKSPVVESDELAALEPNAASPRSSDDAEEHESIGFEPASPIEGHEVLPASIDGTSFRLTNVLFLSFAARFDELDKEPTDASIECGVWGDVCDSFFVSVPAFASLIVDHGIFRGVDVSLDEQCGASPASLAQTWKQLSAAYTTALKAADGDEDDDSRFYAACEGRLDVLYLRLWLLRKPQLAKYFAARNALPECGTAAEQSSGRPFHLALSEATSENEVPEISLHEDSSIRSTPSLRQSRPQMPSNAAPLANCKSCCCEHRNDPNGAEYDALRLRMLREQEARERVRFCEERRRRLLGEIRELSSAVAELQQRKRQRWSEYDRRRKHQHDEEGNGSADGSLSDEEDDSKEELSLFQQQKRRRVAEVARVEQQIRELLGVIDRSDR